VLRQDDRLSKPDPVGDHYGPYAAGQIAPYTLPTDPEFGDQMDLRQIDVTESDDGLRISITTGEITDEQSLPNGFEHVLFHVYIDLIEDQGSDVLPRINAQSPAGFAWDYLAVVDGWGNKLYSSDGSAGDAFGTEQPDAAQIEVDKENNIIHLVFDPQTIETSESLEGLKIYITTWDIDETGENYRLLTTEGGEREFGGGVGNVDPLIIDDVLVGAPQSFVSQLPPTPQVEVTFEVIVPAGTPEDDPLYLTGPFNQFNPADSQYQFSSEGDGLYRLVLLVDEGEFLEYRITRGSFANAEKIDPEDRFANREIIISTGDEAMEIAIEIQGWWDDYGQ
jgi:hypothetical protein